MTKRRESINVDDLKRLKQAAEGRWVEILSRVGNIPIELLDGNHGPCPICGGADRFRSFDDETGGVICNQCFRTGNGDGFSTIRWMTGVGFKEAVGRVAEFIGVDVAAYKTNGKAAKAKAARKKKKGPDQDKDPAKDLKFQKWSPALVAHYLKKNRASLRMLCWLPARSWPATKNILSSHSRSLASHSIWPNQLVGWL